MAFNHPPPSSAEVEERVELYLYFLSGPSWPVLGRTLHFTLPSFVMYLKLVNVEARIVETVQ